MSHSDKFEIHGKIAEIPTSVYANITADEIWTFTLNAASPISAVKPLIVLLFALLFIA